MLFRCLSFFMQGVFYRTHRKPPTPNLFFHAAIPSCLKSPPHYGLLHLQDKMTFIENQKPLAAHFSKLQ